MLAWKHTVFSSYSPFWSANDRWEPARYPRLWLP